MGEVDDTRRALIEGLMRVVPVDSSVIQIGLPGGDMADMAAAAGLRLLPAFSPGLLRAHAACAATLVALPGTTLIAARACEGHDSRSSLLAGVWLDLAAQPVRYRALVAVLAELRAPSILHLGPVAGHADLLIAGLDALAQGSTFVWFDLPPPSDDAIRVLAALPPEAFEAYGLSGSRVTALGPGDGAKTAGLTALILLPRQSWAGFGLPRLARLAANAPWTERLAALTVDPAVLLAKGATPAVLTRLAAARTVPAVPPLPPETVLRLNSRLFGGHLDLNAATTGPLRQVDFLFMPPGQGIFEWALTLGTEPDPEQHGDLRAALTQGETLLADVALVLDMARRQLQALAPMPVGAARLPVSLRLYRKGRRRGDALALSVGGLVLWPHAGVPTLAARP